MSLVALADVSRGAGLGSLCEQILEKPVFTVAKFRASETPAAAIGAGVQNGRRERTRANQKKRWTQVLWGAAGNNPLGKVVSMKL